MSNASKSTGAASLYLEDLSEGMRTSRRRVITADDIEQFAALTGDYSPLHVDEEFARSSRFGRRVVHGAFTASLITAVIGMDIPGRNGIYMSQQVRFSAPVFVDDEVRVEATVRLIDVDRSRFTLGTDCYVGDRKVLEGEALIYLPRRSSQTNAP